MEPATGRRQYDTELPYLEESLKRWVSDELAKTRHTLRDELAVLGLKIEALTISSTREHAEVKAVMAQLQAAVTVVPQLEQRVDVLERDTASAHAVTDATDRLRAQLMRTAFALAGLIVAVAAAVAAFVQ